MSPKTACWKIFEKVMTFISLQHSKHGDLTSDSKIGKRDSPRKIAMTARQEVGYAKAFLFSPMGLALWIKYVGYTRKYPENRILCFVFSKRIHSR